MRRTAEPDQEIPHPHAQPDGAARPRRYKRVPSGARLWGFVRRHEEGPPPRNPEPAADDTCLWLDQGQNRFLVVSGKTVVDDLSPLEFVQFVRELRHVKTRLLFKVESKPDGSTGRSFRVWT